jgi:hypothetical protein
MGRASMGNSGDGGCLYSRSVGELFNSLDCIDQSSNTEPYWSVAARRLVRADQTGNMIRHPAFKNGNGLVFHDARRKSLPARGLSQR